MYRRFLHLTLAFILGLSTIANAATYYVSPTGNDSNDGLTTADAHAWLTLQKAANVAVADDTVNVLAGTYQGATFNVNSGTSGHLITYQTYNGATVIIHPLDLTKNYVTIPAGTVWTDLGLNTAGNAHKWASPNGTITNCNGIGGLMRNHTYWFARTQFPTNYYGHGADPWYYYDAANTRILLNQPTDPGLDEWIVADNGANSIAVIGSYLKFDGFTTEYAYDGFRVDATAANLSSHNIYVNLVSRYNGRRGQTIQGNPTYNTTDHNVSYCNLYSNGEHGFKQEDNVSGAGGAYTCTNYVLNHITTHGNGYHGIQLSNGGDQLSVSNSTAYDNGLNPCGINANTGEGCASFASNYSNGLADDVNWFSNSAYSTGTLTYWGTDNSGLIRPGLSLFSNNNLIIAKNNFHNNHGPAVFGTENGSSAGSNNVFKNNVFVNNTHYDLYLTTLDVSKFYNNTIGGGTLGSIYIGAGSDSNEFKNNAITALTGVPILTVVTGGTPTLDYNAWYSPDSTPFLYNETSYNFANYKAASSQDGHSFSSNFTSEFGNFASADYSITYASALTLRDAGTSLSSYVTDDYAGRTRPQNLGYAIGAYEENAAPGTTNITFSGGTYQVRFN